MQRLEDIKVITLNDDNQIHSYDDEPAIIRNNGVKCWYSKGKRHRNNGPAIICTNGNTRWYYEGKHIDCNNLEDFKRIIKLRMFW